MIAKAPWARRYGHTSVVDAAGAIYVIGGSSYSDYNDVWVTTDKGVDRTRSVLGGTTEVPAEGYYWGTQMDTKGVHEGMCVRAAACLHVCGSVCGGVWCVRALCGFRVRIHVCTRASACGRTLVRMCVCACVSALLSLSAPSCISIGRHFRACVCSTCACVVSVCACVCLAAVFAC